MILLPAISTAAILGYVISEARRFSGVKQDTIRAALLVGAGTLSRYEAGLRAPDELALLRIEDCLSLPPGTIKRRALSVESALQTSCKQRFFSVALTQFSETKC